jgi:hypothetical protein
MKLKAPSVGKTTWGFGGFSGMGIDPCSLIYSAEASSIAGGGRNRRVMGGLALFGQIGI